MYSGTHHFMHPSFVPFFFLLLITSSHQGNGKLDFDFYLWMAVPDTRAESQDINLDKCAFFFDLLPASIFYQALFCVVNLSYSEHFLWILGFVYIKAMF